MHFPTIKTSPNMLNTSVLFNSDQPVFTPKEGLSCKQCSPAVAAAALIKKKKKKKKKTASRCSCLLW